MQAGQWTLSVRVEVDAVCHGGDVARRLGSGSRTNKWHQRGASTHMACSWLCQALALGLPLGLTWSESGQEEEGGQKRGKRVQLVKPS